LRALKKASRALLSMKSSKMRLPKPMATSKMTKITPAATHLDRASWSLKSHFIDLFAPRKRPTLRFSGSPAQLRIKATHRRVRCKRLFGAGYDSFLYQNGTLQRLYGRDLLAKSLVLFSDSIDIFLPRLDLRFGRFAPLSYEQLIMRSRC